ncbi:MAG: IPT/TIG domain-containing protein [Myxococcota bacterium]
MTVFFLALVVIATQAGCPNPLRPHRARCGRERRRHRAAGPRPRSSPSASFAGGERVAVFGSGFTPGAKVVFGDVAALDELVLDDGQINVTAPPHAPGLVDVIVNLPDGQTDTITDGYLYRGPIELTSNAPTSSPVAGGVEVEVQGAGFDAKTRVLVGGRLLEGQSLVDANTIRGRVPSCLRSDAGKVDVIATNGFEQRVLSRGFEYLRALDLEGIDPIAGPSSGGNTIGLRGAGFATDVVVRFDDTPAEITSVDPTGDTMEVRVPPGRHGAVDVSVSRGLETLTLDQAYFYVDPLVVDGGTLWAGHAVPSRGPASGGNLVMVSVVGLVGTGGVTASFGGVPADVLDVRPGQSTVVVKAPPLDPTKSVPSQVQLVIGQHGDLAPAVPYLYEDDFAVTQVDPDRGSTNGAVVALVGSGLTSGAKVTVGGKPATVKGLDHGRLSIRVPEGSPGKVDVEVVVDGKRAFLPGGFEYTSSATNMWAVDPGEGAQSGGRIMRLFGEGFRQDPPEPRFGDEAATEPELIDDHLMIVRLPRGDEGNVNVKAKGWGTLAMALRYFNPAKRFGGTGGGPIPEALNVSVVDYVTGKGVPDAFVILWDDLDTPYQGLTDDRGQITFSDIGFGPMQEATAGADNYTTGTVCDFDARDVTIRLIPLSPSNPGGGGGGPGPQNLPDSIVSGHVSGIDKYIVAEPGSCDARLSVGAPGVLCQPCVSDADCGGGEDRCTDLGKQGGRCTTACDTDVDCPSGYACAGVGGGAVQCVPDPGRRTARCQPTIADVFSSQDVPLTPTDTTGGYSLTVRPGEYAIVCLGGYEDTISGDFVPTVMGVRRHVFAQSDTSVADQDIDLDVPLSRDLRIRLDGAPVERRETERHTAEVYINLGADGVYLMPSSGQGIDQNVFELEHFPVEFTESLYDASFEVYATAIANVPPEAQTGEGSFVHYDQITQVYSDAVFELDFENPIEGSTAHHRRTGIAEPIRAVHGPAQNGELPRRLWAVGDEGHVIAWDGTFWAIQQTPTQNRLRGVWAAADDDVWAVGERATVVRWDGLRWLEVPMPAEVSVVGLDWWGVEGDGTGTLWLWSTHGVWRRAVDGTLTAIGSELTPGGVRNSTPCRRPRPGSSARAGSSAGGTPTSRRSSSAGTSRAPTCTRCTARPAIACGPSARTAASCAGTASSGSSSCRSRRAACGTSSRPGRTRPGWPPTPARSSAGTARAGASRRRSTTPTSAPSRRPRTASSPRPASRRSSSGRSCRCAAQQPTVTGALQDLDLRWLLDPGFDASLNWVRCCTRPGSVLEHHRRWAAEGRAAPRPDGRVGAPARLAR